MNNSATDWLQRPCPLSVSPEHGAECCKTGGMEDDEAVQIGDIRRGHGEFGGHVENPCAEDGVEKDLTGRSKDKRGHSPNTPGEKPHNHNDIEHEVEAIEDLPFHWGKNPIKPGQAQHVGNVHSCAIAVDAARPYLSAGCRANWLAIS